jgi:phage shock protein C
LGDYFEIDPLIVRILFFVLSMMHGAGIVAYIVLAIAVPEEEKKGKKNGNSEEVIEKPEEIKRDGSWIKSMKNIFGLFIVLIGLNLLVEQVFQYSLFAWVNWGIFWALVIILIGVRIISGSNKK